MLQPLVTVVHEGKTEQQLLELLLFVGAQAGTMAMSTTIHASEVGG